VVLNLRISCPRSFRKERGGLTWQNGLRRAPPRRKNSVSKNRRCPFPVKKCRDGNQQVSLWRAGMTWFQMKPVPLKPLGNRNDLRAGVKAGDGPCTRTNGRVRGCWNGWVPPSSRNQASPCIRKTRITSSESAGPVDGAVLISACAEVRGYRSDA